MKRIVAFILAVFALAAFGGCSEPELSNSEQVTTRAETFTTSAEYEKLASEVKQVTASYDAETKTLTFSGEGTLVCGTEDDNILSVLGDEKYPETIVIEPGVTELGDSCLAYSSDGETNPWTEPYRNIKNVKIADTVTKIGDWAFSGCAMLATIELPDNIIEIGDWAFCDCDSLKAVAIPKSVEAIGADAFYNISSEIVIKGFRGTDAEQYANENGIKFEALDE